MTVESQRDNFSGQTFVTSVTNSHTFGSYKKAPFFLSKMQQTWDGLFTY